MWSPAEHQSKGGNPVLSVREVGTKEESVGIWPSCEQNDQSLFFFIFLFTSRYVLFRVSGGRRLLQASEFEQPGNDSFNCTPPAIKEFPPDGFTRQQRQAGFIIIHFVIAIYLFLLLAIVCDDYFVPSIKKICESEYKRIVRSEISIRFLVTLI